MPPSERLCVEKFNLHYTLYTSFFEKSIELEVKYGQTEAKQVAWHSSTCLSVFIYGFVLPSQSAKNRSISLS